MRLKRIGTSDQDMYQGQDGKVYNRKGELIHDREAPLANIPDPPTLIDADANINTPEAS